jgi:hypothetical protein
VALRGYARGQDIGDPSASRSIVCRTLDTVALARSATTSRMSSGVILLPWADFCAISPWAGFDLSYRAAAPCLMMRATCISEV